MFEDMINTQTDDKERKGNIAVVAAACCMVLLAFLVVGLKVWGDNLKQVLLFVIDFLGFPDPHPTGDHICAPLPADQQSDHLHRPWIHSLRRVPLLKNHPQKSDFRNGVEWGKWAQTGSKKGLLFCCFKLWPPLTSPFLEKKS